MKNNKIEENNFKIEMGISAELGGQKFLAVLAGSIDTKKVELKWEKSDNYTLSQLIGNLTSFHNLNGFFDIEINSLSFIMKELNGIMTFEFEARLAENTISIGVSEEKEVNFSLDNISLPFSALPIVGEMLNEGDGLGLSDIKIGISSEKKEMSAKIMLILKGINIVNDKFVNLKLGENEKALANVNQDDIKWVELNKSLGVMFIKNLGFSLGGGGITVYVSAGFSLSILKIEVTGLYLGINLPFGSGFKFGLQGLAVSFNKSPISISGGLYKDPAYDIMYNGSLSVKIGQFTLSALASYGENNGEPSFFLYMLINYPLGGPSFFFVTGLAGGFGVNRDFLIPELKQVKEFPFVKMAMDKNDVKQETPAEMLSKISSYIKPEKDSNFACIGVAFESFSMIQSFALLTVKFGAKINISLLGMSKVSLPPKIKAEKKPIAYAELALKAVYDVDEGSFIAVAALTSESYVLNSSCKLSGGFAFCVWGKGNHQGDFLVTLGGTHYPGYSKPDHYPAVDKLGINWKINSNLIFKGNCYFALTPSCMMAGCDVSLNYESGRIKAWFNACMNFFMKWKPFRYEISLRVGLGAQYRGILATYRLEMSVALNIWGPEFAGTAKVTWFIISFTIKFGNSSSLPTAISWDEFKETFLPKNIPVQKGLQPKNDNNLCMSSIMITDGILIENDDICLVNAYDLKINTKCEMPSVKLSYNEVEKAKCDKSLGIVPMGKSNYQSEHIVSIKNSSGKYIFLESNVDSRNENPAIWLSKQPGLNEELIKNVPNGLTLSTPKDILPEGILPSKNGFYKMSVLTKNQIISKSFAWTNLSVIAEKTVSKDIYEAFKCMESNVKRNKIITDLKNMNNAFSIRDISIGDIGKAPKAYFRAKPKFTTIGSE